MKKKRIFTTFLILLIGCLFALAGFYLYQQSKIIKPSKIKKIVLEEPSPAPESTIFISISKPEDEEISTTRNLTISGKTIPNAKIVILTTTTQEAGVAAKDGSFTTDINLDEGENIIEISAVADNGETAKIKRTVIYTTEDF